MTDLTLKGSSSRVVNLIFIMGGRIRVGDGGEGGGEEGGGVAEVHVSNKRH